MNFLKSRFFLISLLSLVQSYFWAQPCLSGWSYRTELEVNNSNTDTLFDHQVSFVINSQSLVVAGKSQSSGEDIRVLDFYGNQLDFWIDASTYNTSSTTIWVQVDTLPASDLTSIYLFYGNSSATSASNGTTTFELYDDFTGTALSATRWSSCGNISVSGGNLLLTSTSGGQNGVITSNTSFSYDIVTEIDVNSATNGLAMLGQSDLNGDGWSGVYEKSGGTNDIMRLMSMGQDVNSACDTLYNQTPTANTITSGSLVGTWSLSWYSANDTYFSWPGGNFSRSDVTEATAYSNPKFMRVGSILNALGSTGTISVDWARIRRYASIDPVVSVLTEMTLVDGLTASNTGAYCVGDLVELTSTTFSGATYSWVGPSGFTSTSQNPTFTASSNLESGTYYVTASIVGGCSPQIASTDVVISSTTVGGTVSGSSTECIDGNSGVLNLSGEVGTILYWESATSTGGPWSTISTTADSVVFSNLVQTTYYRPLIQSGVCLMDTGTIGTITINSSSVGGDLIGTTDVCESYNSGNVQLVGQNGTITNWESSINSGSTWSTITNGTSVESYSNLGVTTLYRALITSGVCAAAYSDTATITINPKPSASFYTDSVCIGTSTTFTNTSTVSSGNIQDYFWDFGDGDGTVVSNPSHVYTSSGVFSVLLRITTNEGCIDSVRQNVVVYPSPTVNFSQSNVCDSSAMVFLNLSSISSGTIDTYSWDFGDGTGLYYPQDTSYIYASDGSYTVTLTATSAQGCSSSYSKTVTVYPAATVDFTPDSVCLGQSITFINSTQTTSSSITYQWSFGDGGVSTSLNPTYTYTATGTYTVTLQTSTPGGCANSKTGIVEIYPTPMADFTFSNVCKYDSVLFVNTSITSSGTYSYDWDFGDGSTSNLTTPHHLYGTPGSFSTTLDIISDNGCTSSFTDVVTVYAVPIANYSFTNVCLGNSVPFINSSTISSGTLSYEWDFDDAGTSTLSDVNHLYALDGSYDVALISTSNNGCKDTVNKTVQVYPIPYPNFTYNIACDGDPTTFTNATNISSGTVTGYSWDFGDGSNSIVTNPTYQYLNAGTYSVILGATSSLGCTHDTTISVEVSTFPLANFTVSNECLGTSAQFVNTSTISVGTLGYQWDFGDGDTDPSSDPSHLYTASGSYPVLLIAESNLGCIDSVIKYITIYDLPIVEAGPDSSISQGFDIELAGSAIGASSFSWSPTDYLDDNTVYNPTATPLDTITYFLSVTDLNGCINSDSVTISVIEDFRLFIYNVITPDGNGQNDTWKISNIETFTSADISIFDRWGKEVYTVIGYQNDWEGVSGLDQLPDGTYYYTIKFNTSDKLYSGALSILRNN